MATTGTPASLGILGQPGTTTLFGGDQGNGHPLSGARFSLGYWCDDGQTFGVGATYFFLGRQSNEFNASSSGAAGSTILSRPFFNAITGMQDVQLVALPGVASGAIRVTSNSALKGGGVNLFFNPWCQPACCPTDCCPAANCCPVTKYHVDLFVGARWLQLNEELAVGEQVTDAVGNTFMIVDRFETRNNFYGGQVGARAEWQRGRLFVNVLGTVALGSTNQEVRINGSTVITQPGVAPSVQQGGLLALPTNIGTYSRDRFSVVPEIGVNVGYQVTSHVRLFAGYNFLYWSNVVRPGEQIDTTINPTQLPTAAGPGALVGPARPAFVFHESGYWAQGINVGIQFQW